MLTKVPTSNPIGDIEFFGDKTCSTVTIYFQFRYSKVKIPVKFPEGSDEITHTSTNCKQDAGGTCCC